MPIEAPPQTVVPAPKPDAVLSPSDMTRIQVQQHNAQMLSAELTRAEIRAQVAAMKAQTRALQSAQRTQASTLEAFEDMGGKLDVFLAWFEANGGDLPAKS